MHQMTWRVSLTWQEGEQLVSKCQRNRRRNDHKGDRKKENKRGETSVGEKQERGIQVKCQRNRKQ